MYDLYDEKNANPAELRAQLDKARAEVERLRAAANVILSWDAYKPWPAGVLAAQELMREALRG